MILSWAGDILKMPFFLIIFFFFFLHKFYSSKFNYADEIQKFLYSKETIEKPFPFISYLFIVFAGSVPSGINLITRYLYNNLGPC